MPPHAEANRLIPKFFPEAVGLVHMNAPLSWASMAQSMRRGVWGFDGSHDPGIFRFNPERLTRQPTPTLAHKGLSSYTRSPDALYRGLLEHMGFDVSGRVVMIPDIDGFGHPPPVVCHSNNAAARLAEGVPGVFECVSDSLFVYESGHAFIYDHDHRLMWSTSRHMRRVG